MTEKWADYAIVGASYSDDGKHIQKVKIRVDTGDKLINEETVSRQTVVNLLHSGKTIITAYYEDNGWREGAEVRTEVLCCRSYK